MALPHNGQAAVFQRVGVALVNWNGGEFTIPCIHSLLAGTVQPAVITVVDNASHDGSAELIAATFPQVDVLRNERNEGFTGGNNRAIAHLLNQDIDLVWILNNDTVVAKDCLELLLLAAQSHPAAGYSAKIYYETPSDCIWYAGARRHPLHCAPKHELSSIMDTHAVDGVVPVDFVSGCCILTPAHVLRTHGAFVASYVAYSEDSDWCWRVRTAGLPLYYVPQAVLYHRLSASLRKNTGGKQSDTITPFATRLMVRNHLWTVRAHAKPLYRCCFHLVINVGIQTRNILYTVLRGKWIQAQAMAQGLSEGFFQKVPFDAPNWRQQLAESTPAPTHSFGPQPTDSDDVTRTK